MAEIFPLVAGDNTQVGAKICAYCGHNLDGHSMFSEEHIGIIQCHDCNPGKLPFRCLSFPRTMK